MQPAEVMRLYEIDRICFLPGVAYTQAELLFHLRHPDSLTKVVELRDTIVAFVVARVANDLWAHLITLDVLPWARRRGIGTSLMKAMHQEFLRRNLTVSVLEVDIGNTGAVKFYQKLHYETVERLRGYYSGSRDAFRMVRILKPATCVD
jgi:ribosomal-protein-alanine N-acetyltransferase